MPSSFFSTSFTLLATCGTFAISRFSFTFTFIRICGNLVMTFESSEGLLSSLTITAKTCRAEIIPSPVVVWSMNMIWPDCSPPRLYPPLSISSATYLSPTAVLITFPPAFLTASSNPILLMMVATRVFFSNVLCFSILVASIAMIWSPSSTFPFSSTRIALSPSPSSAIPISAFFSFTNFATTSGWSEPQFEFIFSPLGIIPTGKTSAPSSYNTSGATL